MPENDLWLMSAVIFVPTLFALAVLFVPKGKDELIRWITLIGTLVTLVLSINLFIDFYRMHDGHLSHPELTTLEARADKALIGASATEPQQAYDLVARVPWIPRFNIDYYIGVDGISMALILLTTALSFLAMIASWGIEKSVKGYCALFLLLETGMLGTFFALDLFLFYVFWEVMLLPMYFLIGIWGGPRREYAAIKFFLYTLLGSVFILIAFLAFYFSNLGDLEKYYKEQSQTQEAYKKDLGVLQAVRELREARGDNGPINTFDLLLLHKAGRESARIEALHNQAQADVANNANNAKANLQMADKLVQYQVFSRPFQLTMFLLLFIGFAIKVPVFPFHTWLPDAHVEAPTPISMILAGVLLKLGGYGIIRIAYPICPWAGYELAWGIALFGIINIVYGAFAAMAQTDFKKLVAYSSVSHMGYVILGIAVWTTAQKAQYWSWGMNGAMYQMLAHGISSAGMFFCVGVIYDRVHHRDLNKLGGINNTMPLYGGLAAVIFFGAMGLPGLCGFIGEFFTVLSTWNFSKEFAMLAALTVVLTAAYVLWTVQRVYLGQTPAAYQEALSAEITTRELLVLVPLVVLTVVLGVWPDLVLSWMQPAVADLVKRLAEIIPGSAS